MQAALDLSTKSFVFLLKTLSYIVLIYHKILNEYYLWGCNVTKSETSLRLCWFFQHIYNPSIWLQSIPSGLTLMSFSHRSVRQHSSTGRKLKLWSRAAASIWPATASSSAPTSSTRSRWSSMCSRVRMQIMCVCVLFWRLQGNTASLWLLPSCRVPGQERRDAGLGRVRSLFSQLPHCHLTGGQQHAEGGIPSLFPWWVRTHTVLSPGTDRTPHNAEGYKNCVFTGMQILCFAASGLFFNGIHISKFF